MTCTCAECGDSYTEAIKKEKHNYTSVVTTAATCTIEGVITYTCTGCDDARDESIAALGHNYDKTETKRVTCTEDGAKITICSRCGDSITETIKSTGHNWVEATCTEEKHCTNCNQTTGAALGHTTAEGICARCGSHVENEEKKKAIEEENKRHEYQLAIIDSMRSRIRVNEGTITSLTNEYGLGYVGYSEAYYKREADELTDDANKLMNKIAQLSMDTSGYYALEIMRLEDQLSETEELILLYLACANIARLKEENAAIEEEIRNQTIAENRLHQENLQKIEVTYGGNY